MYRRPSPTAAVRGMRLRRRGGILIYVMVLWVLLCGFVSLGVDWGRVQLTKTQLQRAADAAARAAVAELSNGVTATQDAAVNFGSYNSADGTAVAIDRNNDVEFGTWDTGSRTFTVLSGAARGNANAVRVTARRTTASGNPLRLTFGAMVGASTVDLRSQVIAAITHSGNRTYDVVGLNAFTMTGDAFIDTYESSLGTYASQTPTQQAKVATNTNYTFSGTPAVKGDLYYYTGSAPGGATVTGSTIKLGAPLSYSVAALPGSYTEHGAVSLNGNETVTLDSGDHHFTSFVTNSSHCQLIINPSSGPVRMYDDGAFSFGVNAGTVMFNSVIPSNFELHMRSSVTITLPNDFYGVIDAPQCDVIIGGNSVYGSIVARSITMASGDRIHVDLSQYGTTITTTK
jgi:Flp pilus assembly protein TadG